MPFSNHDYLYNHLLTERVRRSDADELFLQRLSQFGGETLDGYDQQFDSFFENIDPETSDATWIEFWLENLFGWSWFPDWFSLSDKRRLYGNFGRHLARRGTRRGIELFLLDFGIVARVHNRALAWGEFVWGETGFSITEPLSFVIEILFIKSPPVDLHVWGEGAYGEFYYSEPLPPFTDKELLDLIRFQQPQAQKITVVFSSIKPELDTVPVWEQLDEQPYWVEIEW